MDFYHCLFCLLAHEVHNVSWYLSYAEIILWAATGITSGLFKSVYQWKLFFMLQYINRI